MLILLSLLAATPVPPPSLEQEVVVIGQRLQGWRMRYRVRGSEISCETIRSTGDPEIDAVGCLSFEACIRQLAPRIAESDRTDLRRSVRRQMKAAIQRDLGICVTARRDEMIADLADRRYRARTSG